jgi:hypothetical protein
VKENFWPSFSNFIIPHSVGIPHWWDIFWWCFQIVIMGALVLALRKIALRQDSAMESKGVTRSGTSTAPPSFPG